MAGTAILSVFSNK